MPNYLKIPFLLPFKFVPLESYNVTPGIHFDDSWAHEQIRNYEMKVRYKQKWKRTDTTKLQLESSIAPNALRILNGAGQQIKTIAWTQVFNAINYGIYELTYNISDIPAGTYFNHQVVTLLGVTFQTISEPIDSQNDWPNTIAFRYKNSFNDFDVAFTTGIEFLFRCEAGIPPSEFTPILDRSVYIDQVKNTTTTKGYPSRLCKLLVADSPGCPPWVFDLLTRIFSCDYINIENKLYQAEKEAKWEISRNKGYPYLGGSLDLVEGKNLSSLEFTDTTDPLARGGIVTAYNIETSWFGPGAVIPVTEVETNQ